MQFISYKIESIREKTFYLPFKPKGYRVEQDNLSFTVTYSPKWEKKNKRIKMDFNLEVKNKIDSSHLLTCTTENSFIIDNYDEVIKHEPDFIRTPDDLLVALFEVCINTLRGILVARLKETYLKNILLPAIDARLFVTRMKKP
jgi:hypothetical protein